MLYYEVRMYCYFPLGFHDIDHLVVFFLLQGDLILFLNAPHMHRCICDFFSLPHGRIHII